MILSKLDVMLCLAFQGSGGPFNVKIIYSDNIIDWTICSKQQIEWLSDKEDIVSIEICLPRSQRRWRQRSGKDKRNIP